MFDENFERKLNSTELAVWKTFISSVCVLLGKRKRKNSTKSYKVYDNYQKKLGWQMSLKILIMTLTPQLLS
jgi:hypothetical protein